MNVTYHYVKHHASYVIHFDGYSIGGYFDTLADAEKWAAANKDRIGVVVDARNRYTS